MRLVMGLPLLEQKGGNPYRDKEGNFTKKPLDTKGGNADVSPDVQARRDLIVKRFNSLPTDVFLYPELRAFPIIKPRDVHNASFAWGKATRVREELGETYAGFKLRLIEKAEMLGEAFVAQLPMEWVKELSAGSRTKEEAEQAKKQQKKRQSK